MSSVNNNDEVKKLREYYEKREKELKAKAAKEREKLAEAQKAELERVSQASSDNAQKNRADAITTINKNDMKHAADIDRVKKNAHQTNARSKRDAAKRVI